METTEFFTREKAKEAKEALNEMFNAIPKSKRMEYLGHLNEIGLFIEAAERTLLPESDQSQA